MQLKKLQLGGVTPKSLPPTGLIRNEENRSRSRHNVEGFFCRGTYQKRHCLEAGHINSTHAPLNSDDDGLSLDTHSHHINKNKR